MHPVKKPHPLGPNKVRLLGGVQYTLDDEPIANGSEGIVYRATPDPWHGHRVAIKVCVRQDGRHTPEAQHEAEMLQLVSQSQHPNILNFIHFEHGVAGGDPPLLVMELMDDSLFDLISNAVTAAHATGVLATQGVMADNPVRVIFRQLVAGALRLHALGLSHGDIKPENIGMLKGQVKLLDFGHTEQRGLRNVGSGTPAFNAPELQSWRAARTLRQPSTVLQSYDDEKADVWALGWTIAMLKLAAQVQAPFLPGTPCMQPCMQVLTTARIPPFPHRYRLHSSCQALGNIMCCVMRSLPAATASWRCRARSLVSGSTIIQTGVQCFTRSWPTFSTACSIMTRHSA